ncbi:hypothetical protein A1Q2_00827 [Trichosporon asahii var. asahii CBS 8904]|uniref:F-box domain-containing protein n=2 Tax=Trichosporon asahii var. asahii TaxID=189963 RepID=K1VWF3_TRIAC|nr:hypothetical protein A1Q1_05776 [Trichosporon asahii var. asahii CBS 2479]EJT45627.1 hypothetical protein A1Q1_05776 [Trichosporon asahii var. asahii CBS 2479]EKD04881.1 hypothetical protein A1Q2_00827 [Trichosporon asahii var. asahii CBS 8904]
MTVPQTTCHNHPTGSGVDGQSAATVPALPAELLFKAFEHLNVNDLRRIVKVNSFFRLVAQPLTYRHGVFTQFGPLFPGANNAAPFLKNPNIDSPHLTEDEQHLLASRVRRLDVSLHSSEMCRAFYYLIPNKLKFDLDVLSMSLKGFGWFRSDDEWD